MKLLGIPCVWAKCIITASVPLLHCASFSFGCLCIMAGLSNCKPLPSSSFTLSECVCCSAFAYLIPEALLQCDGCHLHMFALYLCYHIVMCILYDQSLWLCSPLSTVAPWVQFSVISLNHCSRPYCYWNKIIISESIIGLVSFCLSLQQCLIVLHIVCIYWWPLEYWHNTCYNAVE